jgi:hypothetical protein
VTSQQFDTGCLGWFFAAGRTPTRGDPSRRWLLLVRTLAPRVQTFHALSELAAGLVACCRSATGRACWDRLLFRRMLTRAGGMKIDQRSGRAPIDGIVRPLSYQPRGGPLADGLLLAATRRFKKKPRECLRRILDH